jgi:DNA polymerase III subunit epsilon
MKDQLLEQAVFVVVDVETTGMDPVSDRITEIAMMKIREGILQDEFSTLINPLIPIPEFITRLTGIDDLMVRDAPTAREVAPSIAEFLGDAIFVAHNAPFDWGFVNHTVRRERAFELTNRQLCTVRLSRRLLPQLPSKSLDPVTRALNIRIPDRHRASGDAYATSLVLIKFLSHLRKTAGMTTVDELLKFQYAAGRRPSRRS